MREPLQPKYEVVFESESGHSKSLYRYDIEQDARDIISSQREHTPVGTSITLYLVDRTVIHKERRVV